jgi:hypothetical protein
MVLNWGPSMDIPTESQAVDNRRQCVRCDLSNGIEAVLSDGKSTLRGICTDQSAEGFGILCERNVPWSVGQTLLLNNGGHWHEVQVMNLRQQDGKEQVGVRRISDCGDQRGPSMLQIVWQAIRSLFGLKFASNLQILGICSGFLLCIVVFVIVLKPTSSLRDGSHWLGGLGAAAETDSASLPAAARNSVPPPSSPTPPHVSEVTSAANAAHDRIMNVLSGKPEFTWADLESVLGLSKDQSNKLLSLIRGESNGGTTDKLDTTKIVIENGEDFAAFVKTLPEQAFSFLSDEQRQDMRAMLDVISQP